MYYATGLPGLMRFGSNMVRKRISDLETEGKERADEGGEVK
jgi:hypothetical protein